MKTHFLKVVQYSLLLVFINGFNAFQTRIDIFRPDTLELKSYVLRGVIPQVFFKIPEVSYDPKYGDDFLQLDLVKTWEGEPNIRVSKSRNPANYGPTETPAYSYACHPECEYFPNEPQCWEMMMSKPGAENRDALIYTHYRKYWRGFVLHCPILDHEDRGMMERVRIEQNIEVSDLNAEIRERARKMLKLK